MPEPNVFLNGRFVPASQAHLAIYDAGVVLGATVTEMVRTFRQRLFRLDEAGLVGLGCCGCGCGCGLALAVRVLVRVTELSTTSR